MHSKIRWGCPILAAIAFALGSWFSGAASPAQFLPKNPQRCTTQALAARKSIPRLSYRCSQDPHEDPDEEIEKSPRRRAALRAYLKKLELSAAANWWATSAGDLNACALTNEARALTERERREFSHIEVYGDRSTRLLMVGDPCVRSSYFTRNAYILHRVGGRVYATEVLDAFYTRLDPGVEMQLARQDGQTVVIVETNSEPMPTTLFSTYHVYAIDPHTHRAVPLKLFMHHGKLTHEFEFDEYLFDDEESMKQWHAPELVHNGRLSGRFYVYTRIDNQDQGRETFSRRAYVWNGRYYRPR